MATIALGLLAASCTTPDTGGNTVLGTFRDPAGQAILLSRSPKSGTVYLEAPGSKYVPMPVRALQGVEKPEVVGNVTAAGRLMMLVRGTAPDCPMRHVLLAAQLPHLQSFEMRECGKPFSVAARPDGDVVVTQSEGASPVLYVLHGAELSGPEPVTPAKSPVKKAAVGPVLKKKPTARPTEPVQGVDLDSAPAGGSGGGVDLDE